MGSARQLLKPASKAQNSPHTSRFQSSTSSPRPTGISKSRGRSQPPLSSTTLPYRNKPHRKAPAKPGLCVLLGCRLYTPHQHTDAEVESKIGWHPILDAILGSGLAPADEARLHKYLERKAPLRPFAYRSLKWGDVIADMDMGDIDALTKFDEGLVTGGKGEFSGQHQRGSARMRVTRDDDLDTWPCDRSLSCSLKQPHSHTRADVITKLGFLSSGSIEPSRENATLATSSANQYHSSSPSVHSNDFHNITSSQEQPDLQWKPCSMLDLNGSSTADLRSALPTIPDDSALQPEPSSQALTKEDRVLDLPTLVSDTTGSQVRSQMQPPVNSAQLIPSDQDKSAVKYHALTSDISATVTQLEDLHIAGGTNADVKERQGTEGEDPFRAWFMRCGYLS